MANNNSYDKIVSKALEEVMHDSMLPYSEFVIMDRALPRVEDGLKPVQRRVLYSMLEVGVLPDRPFRKSARIVGDCMGKYHPHGDRSIYDTMVRMAQDFNMGEVLVDGHGNFGSVDGDGAAAMRYTEAKLAPIALELLRDIEKDTVSWSFNFDDSCKEPDMLPGRFPNLLVNGGSGIAVGLATNIPTHNLREACSAVAAYIDKPNITIDELMKVMPGPDFPTGGYMLSSSEIKQSFLTGKGKLILRAKLHIENTDNGKKNIVITEIPYQVNKATLLQRIAKVRDEDQTGTLSYISDIVDESDRAGMRAVIKLKKDAKVNSILAMLYKSTDLQVSFNTNMVAIADGKPKLLSILQILDYYVKYQQKIIYNRTKYDLEACLKKEHILEGLLIAIKAIDEVVKIIKESKNVTDAKITLMTTFKLSDVQAQAILDMRLARLTSLEVERLITELNRLKDLIARFTEILKNPKLQMKIVKKEILEIADKYGSDRKTEIIDDNLDVPEEEGAGSMSAEDVNLIYTPANTIKTVTTKSYNLATKTLSSQPQLYEIPQIAKVVSSNHTVYAFSNLGNCIKLEVGKINATKYKDRGAYVSAYCKNYLENEKLVSIVDINSLGADDTLLFVTKYGMIKVSKVSDYASSKQNISAIKLKEGDQVIYVGKVNQSQKITLFTHNSMAITFVNDVPVSGRVTAGVKGINLDEGDYVVSAMQSGAVDSYNLIFNDGCAKCIKSSEIPESARNRKGTKLLAKSTATLLLATTLDMQLSYVLVSNKNMIMVPYNKIPADKRLSAGKSVAPKDTYVSAYNYQTL